MQAAMESHLQGTAGNPDVFEGYSLSPSKVNQLDSALWRFGENGEFVVRMALNDEDRMKCWRLVYREYRASGYMPSNACGMRYSAHDALPETGTFMVEKYGRIIGTISVYPDSPLHLPAEEMYGREVSGMRAEGRVVAEIGRFAIESEVADNRKVLMKMIEIPCLYARSVLNATDAVITVNPKHESFYRRMMLFDLVGPERAMGSVCGAPAVLLKMDLAWQRALIDWLRGEGEMPLRGSEHSRTVYNNFSRHSEELTTACAIIEQMGWEMAGRLDETRRRLAESDPFETGLFGSVRYLLQEIISRQRTLTA